MLSQRIFRGFDVRPASLVSYHVRHEYVLIWAHGTIYKGRSKSSTNLSQFPSTAIMRGSFKIALLSVCAIASVAGMLPPNPRARGDQTYVTGRFETIGRSLAYICAVSR